MIRINKSTVYFLLIVVLVLFLFHMQSVNQQRQYQQQQQQYGYDKDNKRIVIPPIRLSMSQKEAELTKSAVAIVETDIHKGGIQTTDTALAALRAELPKEVRNNFLSVVGNPSFEDLPDRLNKVSASIVVTSDKE